MHNLKVVEETEVGVGLIIGNNVIASYVEADR